MVVGVCVCVGGIVGGAVAGVLVVAALVLAAMCIYRRLAGHLECCNNTYYFCTVFVAVRCVNSYSMNILY